MTNATKNETIKVGWVGNIEMGVMDCDVVSRWPSPALDEHTIRSVRWAGGAEMRVVYCGSEGRYVFKKGKF